MRKFLLVVAIFGLAAVMATPAMALDFKFGAEYRVRFYDYANDNFDHTNTQVQTENTGTNAGRGNPRGMQLRVRPRFDVSDDNGNITATIRFEYGDTEWGAGGGANSSSFGNAQGGIAIAQTARRAGNNGGGSIGADGVALETKWAYLDFAMPFNVPLRVRAGIQPWYLPKGILIDDDVDGVRAYGSVAPVSYETFWYRAARAVTNTAALPGGTTGQSAIGLTDTTKDNSLDYYGGKVDVNIAKWLNPGAYFIYGDNRANCTNPGGVQTGSFTEGACLSRVRPQWFAGLTTTGDVGFMSYDFDFVYGFEKGGITGTLGTGGINTTGAINNPVNVRGWMIDGGVHIPVGPVKINLLGSYATGDKQNGGSSEAFPLGPGPSWSGVGGQYELIGEGGAFDVVSMTQHGPTNLWMLGATVEYVPVKALWLKAAVGYAGFSEKNGNCSFFVAGSTSCFGPMYTSKGYTPVVAGASQGSGGLAGKDGLGTEIHLRADYTIWTGFKVQGMVGWLIPTSGDTAGKYILQFLYNF